MFGPEKKYIKNSNLKNFDKRYFVITVTVRMNVRGVQTVAINIGVYIGRRN